MKSALKVVNGVEVDSGTKVNTLVENQSQSLSDRNLEVGETIKLNLEECIKVFPNHCEKMQPETSWLQFCFLWTSMNKIKIYKWFNAL